MTPELLAMLGGGVSGFIMKLIGTQMDNQARQFERMLTSQQTADVSADAAAKRDGGVMVRRFLVVCTIFAIVIAPFVFAWTDVGVSVSMETNGFVIMPEIRQTALAIVGFYFGSSQVK